MSEMKRKAFSSEAEKFGSSKGSIAQWFNKTKAKEKGLSVDDVCALVSDELFDAQMVNKKFDLVVKRMTDKYVPSVAECHKFENIKKFVSGINQKEITNDDGFNQLRSELKLCIALHELAKVGQPAPSQLKEEGKYDLASLNAMNSTQI